ncbi:MAG: hypothetical protein EHM78_15000 [Myxococcaceae bacterium]|nr:MAG: hypothetical protein EHM78_15000 [Myxococcaceae bacterium]
MVGGPSAAPSGRRPPGAHPGRACSGCEQRLLDAARAGGHPLDVRHEVRDVASLATMVREGLGISVLGAWALPRDRRGSRPAAVDPRTLPGVGAGRAPGVGQAAAVTGGARGGRRQPLSGLSAGRCAAACHPDDTEPPRSVLDGKRARLANRLPPWPRGPLESPTHTPSGGESR